MKKIAKTFLFTTLLMFTTGLAACNGGGDKGGDPVVTFRLNYKKNSAEDVFKEVTVKKGECVDEPEEAPVRDGYLFNGWHEDQDKDSEFDFEEPITKSTKIFAHWLAKLKCKFDLNYSGAPAAEEVEVLQNQAVARPTDPTRDGYQFVGWTTNKDENTTGTDPFEYFDFTYPFQKNMTLYAQWGAAGAKKVYRFEAEYVEDITKGMGMGGATYSGGQRGKGLIQEDDGSAKASNGRWVHFLYVNGNNLKFKINADAAGTAKIDMRLSAEYKDRFTIGPVGSEGVSQYTIKVNGTAIQYTPIEFVVANSNPEDENVSWTPFANYPLTASVDLQQGENVIEMITDNEDLLYGTAQATAPMIDCLTVESSSNLSWLNAKGSQIL